VLLINYYVLLPLSIVIYWETFNTFYSK